VNHRGHQADPQMTFKQLLQLDAIDVCQIDSCRTGGVQEILSILLMAAKKGVIVCPHSGGVVRRSLTSRSCRLHLGSLRVHNSPLSHRLRRRLG
jgi:L-alanine-DL-glutamate epimerase-like enolase superfamily enzyme